MIATAIILGVILRIISLNQSFWLDEAIQATISQKPLLAVNWAADFQPPAFYVFTHALQSIGIYSEWFLRLPSVLFGVLTIYFLHKLCRELGFNRHGTIFSTFFLATAPMHIYYSTEYRLYSLFCLLAVLSWYFLWKNKWWKFAAITALMLLTHYFSVIIVLSQVVFILAARRPNVQTLFKYLAIAVAPFLLWIPMVVNQFHTAQNLLTLMPNWATALGVNFYKLPPLLLAKFTVGMISPEPAWLYGGGVMIMGLIFLLSMVILLSRLKSKQNKESISFLLIAFLVPVIIAWALTLFTSSVATHRMLFVLPFFYLIMGAGISALPDFKIFKKKELGRFLSLILFVIVLCSNFSFSGQYLLNSANHREDWRSAISYTDSLVDGSTIILFEYLDPWAPVGWYSNKAENYIGAAETLPISENSIQARLDPILNNSKTPVKKIFLYSYLFEVTDNNRRVEDYLKQNGFKLGVEQDFRGVGIIREYLLQPNF